MPYGHGFQSTHPTRECDLTIAITNGCPFHFNPRTLQESATSSRPLLFDWLNSISIHAPYKRVRQTILSARYQMQQFQSTHPTRECDYANGDEIQAVQDISIHAPYKRVRLEMSCRGCYTNPISIHAPYKRVRLSCVAFSCDVMPVFQSTHPTRECDVVANFSPPFYDQFQSTHPTRECDGWQNLKASILRYFNPRTLQESATSSMDVT